MAHAGNLTVVGDPDQSIYSWRNANADGFDNLLEEYPEASVVRLTKNYRSTNGVLQLAAASLQKEGVGSSKRNGGGGGGGGGGRTRGGGGGGGGGSRNRVVVYTHAKTAAASSSRDQPPGSKKIKMMKESVQDAASKTPQWTANGAGLSPVLLQAGSSMDEAQIVATEIERQYRNAKGLLRLEDFAVLLRTNAMSQPFEKVFTRLGLPYLMIDGTTFKDRAEIQDVMAYFQLICNLADPQALSRAVNIPKRGFGKVTRAKLARLAKESGEPSEFKVLAQEMSCTTSLRVLKVQEKSVADLRKFCTFVEEEAAAVLSESPPTASGLLRKIVDFTAFKALLKQADESTADARWGHVEELVTLAGSHTPARFLDSLALAVLAPQPVVNGTVKAANDGSGGAAAGAGAGAAAITGNRAAGEDRGVVICTIHSSKGREWPCVFIPGLENGILPHERSIQAYSAGSTVQLEEERRLLYVAVTRAKVMIYMLNACHRHSRASQESQFLTPAVRKACVTEVPTEKELLAVQSTFASVLLGAGKKPRDRSSDSMRQRMTGVKEFLDEQALEHAAAAGGPFGYNNSCSSSTNTSYNRFGADQHAASSSNVSNSWSVGNGALNTAVGAVVGNRYSRVRVKQGRTGAPQTAGFQTAAQFMINGDSRAKASSFNGGGSGGRSSGRPGGASGRSIYRGGGRSNGGGGFQMASTLIPNAALRGGGGTLLGAIPAVNATNWDEDELPAQKAPWRESSNRSIGSIAKAPPVLAPALAPAPETSTTMPATAVSRAAIKLKQPLSTVPPSSSTRTDTANKDNNATAASVDSNSDDGVNPAKRAKPTDITNRGNDFYTVDCKGRAGMGGRGGGAAGAEATQIKKMPKPKPTPTPKTKPKTKALKAKPKKLPLGQMLISGFFQKKA